MEKRFAKFLKFLFVVIVIITIFGSGFLFGRVSYGGSTLANIKNINLGKPADVDFALFWKVYNQVNSDYVGSANSQDLTYGAISGMVSALGDPYSMFLTPDEANSFSQDLSGQFEGIGAEITQQNNKLIIVSPLDKSPAEKAGLLPKDEILKIDGIDASTLSFQQALDKIRGQAGTTVTLTILRQDFVSPKDFKIEREKITVASVELEFTADNIANFKIRQFGDDTTDLIKKAAEEINNKKPKGIVLDLRNNPGGYLTTSIDVASLFIEDSVIVSEQYKNGKKEEFKTTLPASLKDFKLAVLINEGSASASEIVAGAIQDTGRGKVFGEKSFGKGSVQNYEQFNDKSALRLTVAYWLTPKNRKINGEGILPDIEIIRTDEDIASGKDPQLDRAIEEVKK